MWQRCPKGIFLGRDNLDFAFAVLYFNGEKRGHSEIFSYLILHVGLYSEKYQIIDTRHIAATSYIYCLTKIHFKMHQIAYFFKVFRESMPP